MQEASELSKWVPVIGTLAGAAVGFLASFGTTWLTQKKTDERAQADRQRQRLEDVYRTLVTIRRDYQEALNQGINKVQYHIQFPPPNVPEFPPLIKLEMLIRMYFPDLKDAHMQLKEVASAFGKFNLDLISKNFTRSSTEAKQKVCGELFSHYGKVDKAIDLIQTRVSELTNA